MFSSVARIGNTMDAFEQALAFSARPALVPGHGVPLCGGPSATQALSQATIDVDVFDAEFLKDDFDDDSPMMVASSCPGQLPTTPQKLARSKRALPQAQAGCQLKRKYAADNNLQFSKLTLGAGIAVPCVSCDGMPIALWNQYTSSWRSVDFKDSKWIKVGFSEPWVKQLVDACVMNKKKKNARYVIKKLTDRMQKEVNACLAADALKNKDYDPFSSFTPEPEGCFGMTRRRNVVNEFCPVAQILIGKFKVLCLNNKRQVALKVDEATTAFIEGWMLPLIKSFVDNPDEVDTSHPETASDEPAVTVPGFSFSSCFTPNLRDKVVWRPEQHAWKLYIKHDKTDKDKRMTPGEISDFTVNSEVPADTYEKEKIAAYWRAIAAWNKLDCSTRHRIPLTASQAGIAAIA
jgi:hypothetical protein